MEGNEYQGVAGLRDELTNRMRTRYPDRNFDSQNGETGQTSLEQSIIDALTEDAASIERYKELEDKTNALASLFNTSEKAATFLNVLAETGDPAAAIYKSYGKEAHDAFVNGDASELITSIEEEDAKRRAEDQSAFEEKEKNMNDSIARMEEWGKSKGLSEQEQVDTFMRLYNMLCDAAIGIYSEELFEMAYKSSRYDADVETARREGEVAGRNAKIRERNIKRERSAAMPPSLQGQGVRPTDQPKEKTRSEGDFWLD